MRLAALLSAVLVVGLSAQSTPQTVLFVCEHGAAKSVVAAAHFNKLAAERGLPFRAVSRGTAPDPAIPAGISNGLETDGLALPPGFLPTAVAAADVTNATRVVTFDVTLPKATTGAAVTRWDTLPAFSDGYAPASAAIAQKVDALLRELATVKKK